MEFIAASRRRRRGSCRRRPDCPAAVPPPPLYEPRLLEARAELGLREPL